VGLDHLVHPEPLAHLEQGLVLVGRVDQHRVAGPAASQHVDVVVDGADHHAVQLAGGVLPDADKFGHAPRIPQHPGP